MVTGQADLFAGDYIAILIAIEDALATADMYAIATAIAIAPESVHANANAEVKEPH